MKPYNKRKTPLREPFMKLKIKKRWIFAGIWTGCFVFGSFAWKVLHTGSFSYEGKSEINSVEDLDLTVSVGDFLITREDIEWEYQYYMQQLTDLGSLDHDEGNGKSDAEDENRISQEKGQTPSGQEQKPIIELYNKILSQLIERKLLYQFLSRDVHFDLNDPARFTSCLQEWQKTVDSQAVFFRDEKPRNYLKAMLCEQNILQQYVNERILAAIHFTDEETRSYYEEHKAEFSQPARVTIRQVVLASENEAKKIRARITSQNFANIAKEASISPEAEVGGLLGPFAKGEMPSLFDISFDMAPGEIQGILKSTYGFHIIMLEKKFAKAQLGWEAARAQIEKKLSRKREEEEYKKWVEMALNNIQIKSSRTF